MKRMQIRFAAGLTLLSVGALSVLAQESDQSMNKTTTAAMDQPTTTTPEQQPTTTTTPSAPTEQPSTSTNPSATTPNSDLPKTASPLPLVGMGGLISLASGVLVTRFRR